MGGTPSTSCLYLLLRPLPSTFSPVESVSCTERQLRRRSSQQIPFPWKLPPDGISRDTGAIAPYARIEWERFGNEREIRSADKTEAKGFGNSIERERSEVEEARVQILQAYR